MELLRTEPGGEREFRAKRFLGQEGLLCTAGGLSPGVKGAWGSTKGSGTDALGRELQLPRLSVLVPPRGILLGSSSLSSKGRSSSAARSLLWLLPSHPHPHMMGGSHSGHSPCPYHHLPPRIPRRKRWKRSLLLVQIPFAPGCCWCLTSCWLGSPSAWQMSIFWRQPK